MAVVPAAPPRFGTQREEGPTWTKGIPMATATCPNCQTPLTDREMAEGRCEGCGARLPTRSVTRRFGVWGPAPKAGPLWVLNTICFTVCVLCIVAGAGVALGMIWGAIQDTRALYSVGIVFLAAILTLNVSRSYFQDQGGG